ncbi:6175_t:CDS:1 [Ambispora gerdemannii]|uniref:6175_t:CDS:1 n=1 Tax=Ambispora gerdemannii TaxID=144530 RepID=A0A9N8ZXD1_9GLOM|nr:6175_t:CDS:1 [Ambispora gerdemannii]
MASALAALCLREIFKYLFVSEGEKCDSNERKHNRQRLILLIPLSFLSIYGSCITTQPSPQSNIYNQISILFGKLASTLAVLCLREIFKNFCASEVEKSNSEELNYKRQLFHFALENHHWCHTAISLLWERLFPLISEKAGAMFIATLLNCFDNNKQLSRPLFQYNIFIKQFLLKALLKAIFSWSKLKGHYSQQESQKDDVLESFLGTFKAICFNWSKSKKYYFQKELQKNNLLECLLDFIDSTENTFFEIELDILKYIKNFNYNVSQIPNSKASLEQF